MKPFSVILTALLTFGALKAHYHHRNGCTENTHCCQGWHKHQSYGQSDYEKENIFNPNLTKDSITQN